MTYPVFPAKYSCMATATDNTDRKSAKARWRIRDLVDLEYFLHIDTHQGGDGNHLSFASTARDIYLANFQHLIDDGSAAFRRLLIRRWLDFRREEETATLPGSIYSEISRICLVTAAVMGLFAGIALAAPLLEYSGIRPLNVSVYMGVAVFSQMLLLLLLVAVFFFRAASRSLVSSSILVKLLGRAFSAVAIRAQKGARESLNGRKREALDAATGFLRGRRQVYGSLFFWPVFILMQVFAVCFNVGLLGATLVKLGGSDVAFGWQSTFQVSPRAVSHLVETIALPWRWIVPSSIAYPGLDAIKGSQIVLKDGILSRDTGDLVSWWPFLCFSVLFYGFLPRLVLLISGVFAKGHLLVRLRFDHGDCNRLVRAMTNPVFSTAGAPQASAPVLAEASKSTSGKTGPAHAKGDYVALVPEDISLGADGLEDIAARNLAIHVTERKIVDAADGSGSVLLDALAKMREAPNFAGVLVLQEAWQPPIQESLNFLKHLRHRLGETADIVVGLIGKPGPDTLFTVPREENVRIWKHRVDALGDPYLGVERLVSHD